MKFKNNDFILLQVMYMLITVIVTCYNKEKYIEKCIGSIIGQTYVDLQIIIVDDGSEDKSGSICDQYAKMDDRIYVIHKKNEGVISARNAGLEVAEGDYVSIIDGDDYLELTMYEELAKAAMDGDYDFVQCDMFCDKNNIIFRHRMACGFKKIDNPKNCSEVWDSLLDVTKKCDYITPNLANKLIKKSLVKTVCNRLPSRMKHAEDLVAVIDLIINEVKSVYLMPVPLYHYVWSADSHSNVYSFNRILDCVEWYRSIENIFRMSGMFEKYEKKLQKGVVREILDVITSTNIYCGKFPLYSIDFIERLKGKKIILYGAGRVGRDYNLQLRNNNEVDIVAWLDRVQSIGIDCSEIKTPDHIKDFCYDYVIIAVQNIDTAREIRMWLRANGVDDEKILWEKPKLLINL